MAEAPSAYWLFAAVVFVQRLAELLALGGAERVIPLVVTSAYVIVMSWRWRLLWQIALVLLVLSLVLFFTGTAPLWSLAFQVVALGLLASPPVRDYFMSGEPWSPRAG